MSLEKLPGSLTWAKLARVCLTCLRQEENKAARANATDILMDMAESLDTTISEQILVHKDGIPPF